MIELFDPAGKWAAGVDTKITAWTGNVGEFEVAIENVSLTGAGWHSLRISFDGQEILRRSILVALGG